MGKRRERLTSFHSHLIQTDLMYISIHPQCDAKAEGGVYKQGMGSLRCFHRALEIDQSNHSLWIEYGSFAYILQSHASRQLKQVSSVFKFSNLWCVCGEGGRGKAWRGLLWGTLFSVFALISFFCGKVCEKMCSISYKASFHNIGQKYMRRIFLHPCLMWF